MYKYIERGPRTVGVNGTYLITIFDNLTGEQLSSMLMHKPMALLAGQKAVIKVLGED